MLKIELKLDNTGTLINPGDHKVGCLGKVRWTIEDARIGTFRIVAKDPNQKDPFYGKLDTAFKTEHSGIAVITFKRDWDYNIEWIAAESKVVQKLDPKISVRPDASLAISAVVVILILIPFTRFVIRRFSR